MRAGAAILALVLIPTVAGAVSSADRLREVETERAEAERQASRFARQARAIEDRGLKAQAEAKALSARIGEAEARLESATIRATGAENRLAVLRDRLAIARAPLSRMMAALQRLARRPTLLLIMRPSSIRDFVRTRAMVAGLQPQIAARTKALRGDLVEARNLAAVAAKARDEGESARRDLAERRSALLAMGEKDRVTAQSLAEASGRATREATLRGAEARSIGELVASEQEGQRTMAALAALPNPALFASASGNAEPASAPQPRLPVPGRIVAGFGERDAAGGRSRGLTIAPAANAPVVAPMAGTVAFAAPYRGYGTVVIVRHAGGMVSLVAGLDRAVVAPGREVRRGETLGTAPAQNPRILYELRRGRQAVHPLMP